MAQVEPQESAEFGQSEDQPVWGAVVRTPAGFRWLVDDESPDRQRDQQTRHFTGDEEARDLDSVRLHEDVRRDAKSAAEPQGTGDRIQKPDDDCTGPGDDLQRPRDPSARSEDAKRREHTIQRLRHELAIEDLQSATSQSAPRRLRAEHLVKGVTVGLVLGCISLIGFHRIVIPAVSQSLAPEAPREPAAIVTTAATPEWQLTLPSVNLYVSSLGPYPSKSAAMSVMDQLSKQGVSTAIILDGNAYRVWDAAALTHSQVVTNQPKLAQNQQQVSPLSWPPTMVSTTSLTNNAGLKALNDWLSKTVSALRVETGAADGETSVRDAAQAVHNANLALPPAEMWQTGQMPLVLHQLALDSTSALTFLQKNQKKQAESSILHALATLQNLKQRQDTAMPLGQTSN